MNSELWGNFRWFKIHVIGFTKWEKKRDREKISEKTMVNMFSNVMKSGNPYSWISNESRSTDTKNEETTPRHIINNLLKSWLKRKSLKQDNTFHTERKRGTAADFSQEKYEGIVAISLKYGKKNTIQLEFFSKNIFQTQKQRIFQKYKS